MSRKGAARAEGEGKNARFAERKGNKVTSLLQVFYYGAVGPLFYLLSRSSNFSFSGRPASWPGTAGTGAKPLVSIRRGGKFKNTNWELWTAWPLGPLGCYRTH